VAGNYENRIKEDIRIPKYYHIFVRVTYRLKSANLESLTHYIFVLKYTS